MEAQNPAHRILSTRDDSCVYYGISRDMVVLRWEYW